MYCRTRPITLNRHCTFSLFWDLFIWNANLNVLPEWHWYLVNTLYTLSLLSFLTFQSISSSLCVIHKFNFLSGSKCADDFCNTSTRWMQLIIFDIELKIAIASTSQLLWCDSGVYFFLKCQPAINHQQNVRQNVQNCKTSVYWKEIESFYIVSGWWVVNFKLTH